jgi:hypothetical protein
VRIAATAGLALAVGLLTWLLVTRGDDDSSTTPTATGTALTGDELKDFAGSLNQPVYWAGPNRADRYEVTQTPDGRVYVRYLPAGAEVGAQGSYLTVATYPHQNAFAATRAVARNAIPVDVRAGVAFYTAENPGNVYLAFPGLRYQIEVFHPRPSLARRLVAQGRIRPVATTGGNGSGSSTAPSAAAVDVGELRAVARSTKFPVYWMGPRPNRTYELTQTPDQRIYLRYLPPGIAIGQQRPALTVATYRLRNAYRATTSVADQSGSVRIPVNGGVAFYTRRNPTSVYFSRPGSPVQVEIFDPNARRAHRLVASGQLRLVR